MWDLYLRFTRYAIYSDNKQGHMNKLFDCKYPILEASMNGVSDLKLALSVADAGAYPSFMYFNTSANVITQKEDQLEYLYESVRDFKKNIGNTNIVIACNISDLSNKKFIKIVADHKVSHIEIFPSTEKEGEIRTLKDTFDTSIIKSSLKYISRTTKILTRLYFPTNNNSMEKYFHGFLIKGKESGGKTGDWSVEELFKKQTGVCKIPCIPYGGIGTPHDVKKYISNNAPIVGVGTLFAMSTESNLSMDVKQKLLKSNISLLKDTKQNTVILTNTTPNEIDSSKEKDWNKNDLLIKGLRGDGTSGIVYAGAGLSTIKEIRSVKEIVRFLVSELM